MPEGSDMPRGGPGHRRAEELLGAHARRRFGPGFEERVMRRVGDEGSPLVVALADVFPRVAWAALSLLLLAGAYSLSTAGSRLSATEALLGVRPASLEAVYGLDDGLLDQLSEGGGR